MFNSLLFLPTLLAELKIPITFTTSTIIGSLFEGLKPSLLRPDGQDTD